MKQSPMKTVEKRIFCFTPEKYGRNKKITLDASKAWPLDSVSAKDNAMQEWLSQRSQPRHDSLMQSIVSLHLILGLPA